MKVKSFKKVIKAVENLNTQQYRLLQEQIRVIESRKYVSRELETRYDKINCPHCGSNCIGRWGKRNDLRRYKCKDCRRTFNSLTGTPLARLRRKGHWVDYAQCMTEGISLRKAAVICGIHRNTALKWRHRFLENVTSIKADQLHGIVEAEESYFLKSEKGSKQMSRPPRKRGIKSAKTHLTKEHICVFVGRDRNKNTFDAILDNMNTKCLIDVFKNHIASDALFCSNSKSVYKSFAKESRIRHGCLDMSKGELIKKDIVHIQNVDLYQSQLKDWIIKRFRGVATKYMDNYISWYRELDEFNDNIDALTILLRAKSGGTYKVLPQYVT